MATTNPITGDKIQTKPSDTYADKFDGIDWSVKLNTDDPLCASCGEIECKCAAK
jgi:hypothetical protein